MTNSNKKIIRVASRKSELALIQTKYVISRLQKLYPDKKFEIHTMTTIGDRVLNISLPKIGEKSLFTRDLEDSLHNGGVDFVVHSLKDLPTALPDGMAIGAVLERDDARDALVLRPELSGHTMDTLPAGSIIGTSSLRRTSQIRRRYPQLLVADIRGNLNTRLAKLDADDSKYAGIVLAQAGLERMGWQKRITQVLEPTDVLYAVGQGALAVECRSNDDEVLAMLQRLMCLTTTCRILCERSFLKTLGGGCSAPVAVSSTLTSVDASNNGNANGNENGESMLLIGAVWSLDGATELRDQLTCSLPAAKRKCPFNGAVRLNGNNVVKGDADSNSNSSSSDAPPEKRPRDDNDADSNSNSNSNSTSPKSLERSSPPVYNDDNEINLANLLDANVDGTDNANGNGNGKHSYGGGDADCTDGPTTSAAVFPMTMGVGQEVMGQCPLDELTKKEIMHKIGTGCDPHALLKSRDVVDNARIVQQLVATKHAGDSLGAVTKCPYVDLFDYADDAKPPPRDLPQTQDENTDSLFCGLYQHACYRRELYASCERLGQQLAEQLIKKGALDIMKKAQAEVHSKA